MKRSDAQILREYGPFPGIDAVHGVACDGHRVWFASGDKLNAMDPATGEIQQVLTVAAHAGTAFDGKHLFQLSEDRILKLDPATGQVLGNIPAPSDANSGMAWAEGSLWVGQYRERKIHQVDPETGEVLRTLESDRFVTGISWVEGELWHATWEHDASELRRIDPRSGQVLEALAMPEGVNISGLEADGDERFYCGGGPAGKIRLVQRKE